MFTLKLSAHAIWSWFCATDTAEYHSLTKVIAHRGHSKNHMGWYTSGRVKEPYGLVYFRESQQQYGRLVSIWSETV
eukprot:5960375-Amphidinium_carterae.1